jgi:acetyl esterase
MHQQHRVAVEAGHSVFPDVAGVAVPPQLLQFQLTLRAPTGETPAHLLAQYDEYTNGGAPEVQVSRQVAIREIAGWRVTADVYRPAGSDQCPTLVWFHGGAWVMGSPWTHRRLAAELAVLGLVVIVVDYRRAPKHRFPAACDDAADAVAWAQRSATRFGGDPERLVIGGDSAGANLAAAVMAQPGGSAAVTAALLCYGIYDVQRALPLLSGLIGGPDPDTQLYLEPADVAGLADDPRLHPERHCENFAPSLVLVGERDPLAGESTSLAARLHAAGVPSELTVVPGAPHGVLQLPGHPGHQRAFGAVRGFLHDRELLATASRATTGLTTTDRDGRAPASDGGHR